MGNIYSMRRRGYIYPDYTFTGDALFADEGDGDWNIKLITSGTFVFTKLGNAYNGIEVFAVGGGGAGSDGPPSYTGSNGAGGGGYTNSGNAIKPVFIRVSQKKRKVRNTCSCTCRVYEQRKCIAHRGNFLYSHDRRRRNTRQTGHRRRFYFRFRSDSQRR